eukprot:PITA_23979
MGDFDGSTGGEALNGAPRIRVRARQGQSTDPHSVAERQRCQRIAQNLKDLHKLVPNAKKTDRASMLDEIIEYVELLQTQIKVVSASKLGSVDSFGPLTPNVAAKASASLLQPGGSLFDEGREFENNIVKFMERDMNGATEYLRSKGLDLIPLAQARALSDSISNEGRNLGGLGSSRSPVSIDKLNTQTNASCSRVIGMGSVGSGSDLSSKGNEAIKKGKGLVPTHESNGVDSVIISCLSKIMEKE